MQQYVSWVELCMKFVMWCTSDYLISKFWQIFARYQILFFYSDRVSRTSSIQKILKNFTYKFDPKNLAGVRFFEMLYFLLDTELFILI